MVRWEPGARSRLRIAALELFTAQGFDRTTVAEIAAAAGLTERTFFRHFADKREVLFDGQEQLERAFLDGLAAAPADAPPMAAVTAALEASASFFADDRRDWSRRRQAVLDTTAPLRERELLKMASLASALAAGLQRRGAAPAEARLAAETGVSVFGVAFLQWIGPGEHRSLAELEREAMRSLRAMAASPG